MKTGTTVPYATKRINEHILQFNKTLRRPAREQRAGRTSAGSPTSRAADNIFPHIDYRIYAS